MWLNKNEIHFVQVIDQAKLAAKIAVLPVNMPLSADMVEYPCHRQLEFSDLV